MTKETKDKIDKKKLENNTENKSIKDEIAEWVVVIVLAIVFSVLINTFILINATVPSASMENTVMTGDRLFGYRLAYRKEDPKRGDIVIFRYPDDESQLFIKRTIGLPGETVEVIDGKVYINGSDTPLDEPYLAQEMIGSFGPYEVPEDSYFMMGDNRNYSRDSRFWENQYVHRNQIVGRALFRYAPRIGKIAYSHQEY